ncbi:hypothetical protein NMY22_g6102 [Coprinellus aureogranulatus]|nr:hypothetical protein NMY22_g6102 [Coprinellus aureogranulatus]
MGAEQSNPLKRTRGQKHGLGGKQSKPRTEKDRAASRKSSTKHNHRDIEKTRAGWRLSSKSYRERCARSVVQTDFYGAKFVHLGSRDRNRKKAEGSQANALGQVSTELAVTSSLTPNESAWLAKSLEGLCEDVSLERLWIVNDVLSSESPLDRNIEKLKKDLLWSSTDEVESEVKFQTALELSGMDVDEYIRFDARLEDFQDILDEMDEFESGGRASSPLYTKRPEFLEYMAYYRSVRN